MGIKVLYGLGVYSWGFEEIIKHDPTTARNEGRMAWGAFQPETASPCVTTANPPANGCAILLTFAWTKPARRASASSPAIWAAATAPVPAFVRYRISFARHQRNGRIHQGPASRAVLGMSAWGVDLGGGAKALEQMTGHLDFLTDVTDQSARKGRDYRQSLTSQPAVRAWLARRGRHRATATVAARPLVLAARAHDRPEYPVFARGRRTGLRILHGSAGESSIRPHDSLSWACFYRIQSNPANKRFPKSIEGVWAPKSARVTADIVQWLLELERAYMDRAR